MEVSLTWEVYFYGTAFKMFYGSFILLATKKTFFILKLALHIIVYIKKKTTTKAE